MSCIAELYFSNSTSVPGAGELDPSSPYLQSPSYQIPALWLALFEPKDLLDVQREDGDESFPYAVKRRTDAILVLAQRSEVLRQALPSLRQEWFEQFQVVLESASFEYVHMDTSDIGQMAGSWDAWKESLVSMLQPLVKPNPESLQSWVEAVIPEESTNMSWSYCGSGGDEPMPWEDDAARSCHE
jgi:hypothetical protein